jgi:hypothetical protein
MGRSQYLAQALAGMQPPPPQPTPGVDLGSMKGAAEQRKAWEAANPGQNFARQRLGEIVANVQGVPGRIAQVPSQLAGLFSLGRGGSR